MKIALFTGTAYRHIYYANKILANYEVVLHVREQRSNRITDEIQFPCHDSDRKLLRVHSDSRLKKEKEYFLPEAKNFIAARRILEIENRDLNSSKVITAVKETKPSLVLVYGIGLLKKELLAILPKNTINLHAGLSPWYKGAATLYWPVYFMEPQYVGFTFHLIDEKIDHGSIIHQNRPEIYPNDGIHDLGCRTIVLAAADILKILKKIEKNQIKYYDQPSTGKIFYSWNFKPHHLRVTNYLMKKGLIKEYLANKSLFPDPKIISQI